MADQAAGNNNVRANFGRHADARVQRELPSARPGETVPGDGTAERQSDDEVEQCQRKAAPTALNEVT